MNQQRYKKIYYRVWSGKLYKLVRIEGVKYDCEEKKIINEVSSFNKEKEFTTERTEAEEYVKKLLIDTKQAGKMKPDLTLKIIISNVMEKFKLDTEQSMSLIHKVFEGWKE